MTRNPFLPVLLGGAAVLIGHTLAPFPVRAHGIESTLERISALNGSGGLEKLEVQSSFSNGIPAQDASVRLLPASGGDPIELGRTGADGRLRFDLPGIARAGGEIQVDAGPGHRDYLELSDIEPSRPGAASATHADNHSPRPLWSWKPSTALLLLGLAGGVGLLRRQRPRG